MNNEKTDKREKRDEKKDYKEETKEILLKLAKEAIENYLENIEKGIIKTPEETIDKAIKEKKEEKGKINEEILKELDEERGVFVTLRKNNQVRGCIGTLKEDKLWINVQKYAIFSAFNDPRFPPLQKDELPQIKIEISIIENVEDVKTYLK
jgi:uncharacterized protein (TIGR00296 family)